MRLPMSPPWATYPLSNPRSFIKWSNTRAISDVSKFLSSGGPDENVKPGIEGTIRWYGRVSGVYSCRKRSRIGRNSKKLPIWNISRGTYNLAAFLIRELLPGHPWINKMGMASFFRENRPTKWIVRSSISVVHWGKLLIRSSEVFLLMSTLARIHTQYDNHGADAVPFVRPQPLIPHGYQPMSGNAIWRIYLRVLECRRSQLR
jgi:hypothetical protein